MTPEPTNRVAANSELVLPGFTECPACSGSCNRMDDTSRPFEACPSCSGLGVVPDPAWVETVAQAMWDSTSTAAGELDVMARAALLAYARKAKEQA